MDYRDETIEKEDFYQMYLDDLSEITPCTEAEREELLEKLLLGEEAATSCLPGVPDFTQRHLPRLPGTLP